MGGGGECWLDVRHGGDWRGNGVMLFIRFCKGGIQSKERHDNELTTVRDINKNNLFLKPRT